MIVLVPEPISATLTGGGPVMIIGFRSTTALVVTDEGGLQWVATDQLRVDWRYDWKTATWIDLGPYEEIDADEEEADDRGEEISGDVPDADGADGGGEGIGEDRADWGMDPGEEGAEA